MKTDFNQSAFTPFANTINDVAGYLRLVDDLGNVERFLFKDKEGPISAKASEFLSPTLAGIFGEIEKGGMEPEGDAKQRQFLKDLIAYLGQLPQVRLTLAFEPTGSFVTRINGEISDLVGKKALLDIVINQYLIGGAIIEYGGKVVNETLVDKLNEVVGAKVGIRT